ncbi:MAG: helix-turn-helix domain-containing protein [Pseudolabrys sp.]|nr:helix-turn-helix domain-containing protein [Pseudolabrys sp.]
MSAGSRSKSGAVDEAGRLTPGAHLRAEIERLGLDQVAVSKATGVSRQSINNVINGRQTVSRALAGKLGRLTGRNSEYWLAAFFDKDGETHSARESYVSGFLVNHQLIRAVKDGVIRVAPFDSHNVRAAAVDLTLGKGLTLTPGVVATARTRERVELPVDYLGRIGIVGALAAGGILAIHALQLEPGFKGEIEFSLFNVNKRPIQLNSGQPVVGLEIFHLATTPDL